MLNTGKLAGKTILVTGASRGIGKAIAVKAAKDGANIVVAAKTAEAHSKLPGTIYTAAKEIESAGGKALPCVVDIRDEGQVQECIDKAVKTFGGIDIVINNASAIDLRGTQQISMKKFDLMHQINTRGTFLVSKLALPYLKASKNNPHILNISPPLNLKPYWFKGHAAYTIAKYGMSMCVLGMAEEFKDHNIAVNALWPKTAILTAAMEYLSGSRDVANICRKPEIMADAAYVILTKDARSFTGHFAVDEDILKESGCQDLEQYSCVPGSTLFPDYFLDDFLTHPTAEGFLNKKADGAVADAKVEGNSVNRLFSAMSQHLDASLVDQAQAVYVFNITGSDSSTWFIDLKTGTGACGQGMPQSKPDVSFSMGEEVLQQMFRGQLQPTAAFMTGKLKLEGDMRKAMALEKVMNKMQQVRGYHTRSNPSATGPMSAPCQSRRALTTSSAVLSDFTDVPQVFDRIKKVASAAVVDQVRAIYLFDVDQKGKYYVDLKNGEGEVGQGDPNHKPDVTIQMNEEIFLKIFNRELAPATAFMTGKVKISGDLTKALTLEKVMKAAREAEQS